jgi:hypothetical protein
MHWTYKTDRKDIIMQHLCNTCQYEFATCPSKAIVFGIDENAAAVGEEADRVVKCGVYKREAHREIDSTIDASKDH